MKKTITILTLLLASVTTFAQQPILFKIKYLPDRAYKANTKMDMNMQMDINAPEKKQDPMAMKNAMSIDVDIKTGAKDRTGAFPVVYEYKTLTTNITVNGKETSVPTSPLIGKRITGIYDARGEMRFDSIPNTDPNKPMLKELQKMVGKLLNQIKFPEKPLAVGESFTQEVPFDLPVAGIQMQMAIKIVYKLIKVEGNLAHFDLVQNMTINFNGEKDNIKMAANGEGSGSGRMVHNIKESYPEVCDSDMIMNVKMDMGDKGSINMKMDLTSKQNTVISANKPQVKKTTKH